MICKSRARKSKVIWKEGRSEIKKGGREAPWKSNLLIFQLIKLSALCEGRLDALGYLRHGRLINAQCLRKVAE